MESRHTFSIASDAYAKNRPQYPPELFGWLADQCEDRNVAWDCATGNGQAALGLARHFAAVEATDISPEQIEHGFPAANVTYSVQPAEHTRFPNGTFDLVAVAQGLHWFDFGLFWPEVSRTAKRGAFFCAWGYDRFEGDAELEASLFTPVLAILDPFWAPQNRIMWRGYRSDEIAFPFARVDAPAFTIEVRWTVQEIVDHMRTWSAYKKASADPGLAHQIAALEADAIRCFQSAGAMTLSVPLQMVAGRIS